MLNPKDYGPVIAPFLHVQEPPPLGPGKPDTEMSPKLVSLTVDSAFADKEVVHHSMAECCLAGLLLLHNNLNESHRISQRAEHSTGSYWHAIMHRREPDYPNAGYWFRKTGSHPIHTQLAEAAKALAERAPSADGAKAFLDNSGWDPFHFLEFCESSIGRNDANEILARQIQQAEWKLLFDFTYRAAITAEGCPKPMR